MCIRSGNTEVGDRVLSRRRWTPVLGIAHGSALTRATCLKANIELLSTEQRPHGLREFHLGSPCAMENHSRSPLAKTTRGNGLEWLGASSRQASRLWHTRAQRLCTVSSPPLLMIWSHHIAAIMVLALASLSLTQERSPTHEGTTLLTGSNGSNRDPVSMQHERHSSSLVIRNPRYWVVDQSRMATTVLPELLQLSNTGKAELSEGIRTLSPQAFESLHRIEERYLSWPGIQRQHLIPRLQKRRLHSSFQISPEIMGQVGVAS